MRREDIQIGAKVRVTDQYPEGEENPDEKDEALRGATGTVTATDGTFIAVNVPGHEADTPDSDDQRFLMFPDELEPA